MSSVIFRFYDSFTIDTLESKFEKGKSDSGYRTFSTYLHIGCIMVAGRNRDSLQRIPFVQEFYQICPYTLQPFSYSACHRKWLQIKEKIKESS
jgi:hypothetical protein